MAERAMQQFMYMFADARPGFATHPETWTDAEKAAFAAHSAYFERICAEGIMVFSGRALGGPAFAVIEAESEEAARRVMEADPFVSSGVVRATLYPFRTLFARRNGVD